MYSYLYRWYVFRKTIFFGGRIRASKFNSISHKPEINHRNAKVSGCLSYLVRHITEEARRKISEYKFSEDVI